MGGEWGQYGVMINNIAPGVVYSDSAIANYGPLGEQPKHRNQNNNESKVTRFLTIRRKSVPLVDWVEYMKIVSLQLYLC